MYPQTYHRHRGAERRRDARQHIPSGGSLTSNGITVHTHTHGGVRTGPGHHGRPAMTAVYRGMNPQGTGTLSDSEHLKNSVRDILTHRRAAG